MTIGPFLFAFLRRLAASKLCSADAVMWEDFFYHFWGTISEIHGVQYPTKQRLINTFGVRFPKPMGYSTPRILMVVPQFAAS